MMNTVRDTFSSIGDRGGDIARSVGSGTAQLARRVGGGTASVARRIGPRRALLGVAVAAVAIGGSILVVRYLRARRERDSFAVDREEDLAAASRVVPPGDRTHVPGAGARSPL
jgi:hypothetical protein